MDTVADKDGSKFRFHDMDEARDAFMHYVDERRPDCRAALCTPKGIELAGNLTDIQMRQLTGGERLDKEWREASDALRNHIERWAARWRLIAVPDHVSRQDQTVPEWRRLSRAERERWSGSSVSFSWIVAIARRTLKEYAICRKYGEPMPIAFSPLFRPGATYPRNLTTFFPYGEIRPFVWNRDESRKDARERLVKMIDAAFDHVERIERASEYGIVPAHHFDWLVRFQVDKHSHAEIARSSGLDSHTTVMRAVNATAELIGLEPRDGKLKNRNRLGKLKSPNRVTKPRKPNTKRI